MVETPTDYSLYRGRCKELSEKACTEDPSLRLVRGHYVCPVWGYQEHWWCIRQDGTILDPSVRQFPTKGVGAFYEEYDGTVECEYCGKIVQEDDAYKVDHHLYCTSSCYSRDIGF